jgi:hypothetical protein
MRMSEVFGILLSLGWLILSIKIYRKKAVRKFKKREISAKLKISFIASLNYACRAGQYFVFGYLNNPK